MTKWKSLPDLEQDAMNSAETYFKRAIKVIDKKFWDGYAEKHPELIVGFMNCCATEFQTLVSAKVMDESTIKMTEYPT